MENAVRYNFKLPCQLTYGSQIRKVVHYFSLGKRTEPIAYCSGANRWIPSVWAKYAISIFLHRIQRRRRGSTKKETAKTRYPVKRLIAGLISSSSSSSSVAVAASHVGLFRRIQRRESRNNHSPYSGATAGQCGWIIRLRQLLHSGWKTNENVMR